MRDTMFHQLDGNVAFAASRIKQEHAQVSQVARVVARNRTITRSIVFATMFSGLFLGGLLYVLLRRGLLTRVEQLHLGSEVIGRCDLSHQIPKPWR